MRGRVATTTGKGDASRRATSRRRTTRARESRGDDSLGAIRGNNTRDRAPVREESDGGGRARRRCAPHIARDVALFRQVDDGESETEDRRDEIGRATSGDFPASVP